MKIFSVGMFSGLFLLLQLLPVAAAAEQDPGPPPEPAAAVAEAASAEPGDESEAPQLTPAQREAVELAEAFAAFDRGIWLLVEERWGEPEACLEQVDQHLEANRETLKKLLADATIMRCESKGAQRAVVSINDDEAGELYRSTYAEKTADLQKIRFGRSEEQSRERVVRQVRQLERDFRQDLCLQILEEAGAIRTQPSEAGQRTQRTSSADF